MPDPELPAYPASKLGPPHRSTGLVVRPHLLARLNTPAGLVLVVAPAGSGKTALLASWAGTPPRRLAVAADGATDDHGEVFAWYSLDPDDREPTRFVDGLAAALERRRAGIGRPARVALARGGGAFAALSLLLTAVEGHHAVTVILDDGHHLDGARQAEDMLAYLIRNRPASLRIVVASRTIPLVPALSATAARDLVTLGRDDLLFNPADAASLLAAHDLSAGDRADLLRVTGGWAMGLLLLAHGHVSEVRFLRQPLEALSEYVMTQIVDRLEPDVRQFALESALLGWFTADEADLILQRHDSGRYLTAVVRKDLFVETQKVGDEVVVRYHDLLAATLATALRGEDSARFARIHRRAAEARAADPLRALSHCLALDDPALLAAFLEPLLPALRARGLWETVIQYGAVLPDGLQSLLLQRFLSFAYYVRGDDGPAIAAADRAMAMAAAAGDTTAAYSALVLRANPLIRQDRAGEALASCLPALQRAREEGHAQGEAWLAEICADALLQEGRVDEGRALYERVIAAANATTGPAERRRPLARTYHNLAARLCNCGDDAAAESLLDEATRLADEFSDTEVATLCQATRTVLLVLRGQNQAAAPLALTTAHAAQAQGNMAAWHTALLVRALACGHLGDVDSGIKALDQHEALVAAAAPPAYLGAGLPVRARLLLAAGDRDGARAALARAQTLGLTGRDLGILHLEQGALALAEGRDRDAERLLGQAAATLAARALRPDQARALVLRAQALVRLGKEGRAVGCLAEAGTLAMGRGWLGGLEVDAEPALGALRALSSHWRLQGKGRQIVAQLLAAGATGRVRLMPAGAGAARAGASSRQQGSVIDTVGHALIFSPFGEGVLGQEGARRPLTRVRGEKSRELLAFALWKARPVSRDDIIEALWDGELTTTTLGAMRTASYQIRRYLGAHAWERAQDGYALTVPVEDDFRTLLALAVGVGEATAPPAQLIAMATRGVQLYQGPYLPWCYSTWTAQPRALAQTAILSLLSTLVAARRALGQQLAALEAAELGLAIAPYHEPLRQAHMQILVDLGRPDEALDSYRRHLRLLEDEGLAQPSAALRELASSLRQR